MLDIVVLDIVVLEQQELASDLVEYGQRDVMRA